MRKELILNKLAAILMLVISYTVAQLDSDGTAFILMMFFAVPMFFSKDPMF